MGEEMKSLIIILLFVYGSSALVTPKFECTKEGNFPDTESPDCRTYFRCLSNTEGVITATKVQCPISKVFSWSESTCVYPEDFECPNMVSSTTAPSSSSTSEIIPTVGTSTTPPPPTPFACPSGGRYPDPDSVTCDTYLHCLNIDGEFFIFTFKCVPGKFFDPNWNLCDKDYKCPK